MTDAIVRSTCWECSVKCGSLVHVRDGRVVKITSNPHHPHSEGAFCVKGMNAPIAALERPDRPLYPLRRRDERGAGQWERISWDEALGEIASRLGEVKRRYGALAICGAVSNAYFSRGAAMALLLRSLGTPNHMINQDLCQGCRNTGAMLTGLGAAPWNELKETRCVLIVGKSPSESDAVQWMHLKSAKRRGSTLIVVDPCRTQVARLGDLWLAVRPGADAALALSMIDVLFTEGLWDREFVGEWCVGTERLRERARQYPPGAAAEITALPPEQIVETARRFATEKPACLVLGHGIDAQANGVQTARAFHCLLALTGNVDRPGANRMPKRLPGFRDYWDFVHDPEFRLPREIEEQIIGGREFPFWAGPGGWAKASHNPSVIRAILTGEPYPVRALYVSGVNIVCTYPGMQETIAALRSLDLLVAATDHMTPTAELADYVLPKTTVLEEEEVSWEPGGPCLSLTQRVVLPHGEARTDFEIAIGLRDKLRSKGLIDYDLLPWRSHREFLEFQLKDTGIPLDDLRENGFYAIGFGYEGYRAQGFPTPSGKIELASSLLEQAGYEPLPDHVPPSYAVPDPSYPLTLLTGIRTMTYHHSRFRNHDWARKIQADPELRVHPATAARHGVAEGGWVWVETPRGNSRVRLRARLTDTVPPDVVTTGMGWWYPEQPGFDHGALTVNVDAAIPYGPPWDPITGSAEARNVACRIRRANPEEFEVQAGPAARGEERSWPERPRAHIAPQPGASPSSRP
ncbi:MAG: molybdopterin-dependent oxidoreductase [Candidatus Methylomirabilia bacterium]